MTTASAKEACVAQLVWKDPQKMSRIVLWRMRSEQMSDNETDITKQPILPYYQVVFKEQDYLAVELKADATDAQGISASKSKVRVPVTCRNKRTGAVYETTIGYAGIDKFTFISDASVWATAEEKEWGSFQIPLGVELKLGQKNPFNSRVLISPYDHGTA